MKRTDTAWILLPALLMTGSVLGQAAPGSPEFVMANNDLNKDGIVTREEAINAGRALGQAWNTYDLNKDDKVDLEELKSIRAAASPELCRHGFSCATENLWRQERFELKPAAGGSPYIIDISFPFGAAPAAGYPVVYLLDASMAFGTLTDIAHYQEVFFTPTVVVGVSYPDPFEVERRGDFVPPRAEAFLSFLSQDIRAEVAKRVKIDIKRQALFGHSLSGLFALYVLFSQPQHFDTYVAGDPTMAMGGYRLLQQVPPLQKQGIAGPPRRVLLTRGVDGEAPEVLRFAKKAGLPLPKEGPPDPNAVSLAEFANMLQSIKGLSVSYVEFPGETHSTMVPAHLGRGMRWTLTGWDPP
jgi:uncharacterized protein